MQFKIAQFDLDDVGSLNPALLDTDKITVQHSPGGGGTVCRRLDSGEDILTVAEKEFPAAYSFNLYIHNNIEFDGPDIRSEANQIVTYFLGKAVFLNQENDSFSVALPTGVLIELAPENIVFSADTRVPIFECPQTTYHQGDKKGTDYFDAEDLRNLATGRAAKGYRPNLEPEPTWNS